MDLKASQELTFYLFLGGILQGANALQFILEHFATCLSGPKAQINFNSMNTSITNNKLRSSGEIIFSETLFENDGIFDFQMKTCPTDKTCGNAVPIQIKELCRYFTAKSVFGNRFGDQFTPPISCPIKEGTYRFNMTINMKYLTRFPGAKLRMMGKLTVLEVLQSNRRRPVSCIEATISSKP